MKDIVILDGARTPMAEYNGQFTEISAIDLGVEPSAGARQVTFAPLPLMVPTSAVHSNVNRSAGVSGSSTTAVPYQVTSVSSTATGSNTWM